MAALLMEDTLWDSGPCVEEPDMVEKVWSELVGEVSNAEDLKPEVVDRDAKVGPG